MQNTTVQRRLPWYAWALVLVALAVLVRVAVGVWNTFTPANTADIAPVATVSGGATQTSEGGQVTIKATWNGVSTGPLFDIVMDTHAVDLDGYDLVQLAVLRVDGREVQPTSWVAPKGGHHRQGALSFPATASDGKPLIETATRTIELVISDVAGVPERVFRWTL
jgi:hypothetical protein